MKHMLRMAHAFLSSSVRDVSASVVSRRDSSRGFNDAVIVMEEVLDLQRLKIVSEVLRVKITDNLSNESNSCPIHASPNAIVMSLFFSLHNAFSLCKAPLYSDAPVHFTAAAISPTKAIRSRRCSDHRVISSSRNAVTCWYGRRPCRACNHREKQQLYTHAQACNLLRL